MADKIDFTTDTGASAGGLIALPKGDTRAPGIVLLHEWWGLNGHVHSLVDRLAEAGFIALAPDLYDNQVAKDAVEAQRLMTELRWPLALGVIAGARAHLSTHPRCTGKVGVMGFCMGGAGTFVAACHLPGFSAAAPFYGVPPDGSVDWSRLVIPVMAHFASRDTWATVERATEVQTRVNSSGGRMELHVYDADHAFVNDTRPEVFSPENARLAWERTLYFMRQHME